MYSLEIGIHCLFSSFINLWYKIYKLHILIDDTHGSPIYWMNGDNDVSFLTLTRQPRQLTAMSEWFILFLLTLEHQQEYKNNKNCQRLHYRSPFFSLSFTISFFFVYLSIYQRDTIPKKKQVWLIRLSQFPNPFSNKIFFITRKFD